MALVSVVFVVAIVIVVNAFVEFAFNVPYPECSKCLRCLCEAFK